MVSGLGAPRAIAPNLSSESGLGFEPMYEEAYRCLHGHSYLGSSALRREELP